MDEEEVLLSLSGSEGRYCIGVCTCGNNCHENDGYHLGWTTWNGQYPSLHLPTNQDAYAEAMVRLGVQ